ncbi:hypothetical protein BDV93DRAFT_511345 [Ceratobasidium sp. AG-I]|nr:hypothetical protein BDV93DRAFT_511345 [Ceratobasidium sp. AG-I]
MVLTEQTPHELESLSWFPQGSFFNRNFSYAQVVLIVGMKMIYRARVPRLTTLAIQQTLRCWVVGQAKKPAAQPSGNQMASADRQLDGMNMDGPPKSRSKRPQSETTARRGQTTGVGQRTNSILGRASRLFGQCTTLRQVRVQSTQNTEDITPEQTGRSVRDGAYANLFTAKS